MTAFTDLYIDGAWRPASGDRRFAVHDPATGEQIAAVADGGVADARAAATAAANAQDSWAATPARERSEILRRAFELLIARKEEFAQLMTREMGKPIAQARGEVDYGAAFLRWFAEEAVRVRGDFRPNPDGPGTIVVSHRPVGPVYALTPWNFPLAMATRKIGPALAAGCTVVVKPAELTPLTTLAFVDVLVEAGLPAGVVNVVTTSDPAAQSSNLLTDRRLRKISFTGSTPVGVHLLRAAAQNVMRTSMELGGNAPVIVFDDADLDRAVDGVMAAKFRNIGQACTAANRIYVHEAVADEFARRIVARVEAFRVGPGVDETVDIGPLIDAKAVTHSAELVADAVATGASLLCGGQVPDGPGNFFTPAVLDHVRDRARLTREEIFGPVLGLIRFVTEDEVVAAANATEYGLASYVFTENLDRGRRMITSLRSGMMGLNTSGISNAAAPFGGVKSSGLGREGGFEGIVEYLDTKYTMIG